MGERVLEGVLGLGPHTRLVHELRGLQPGQAAADRLARQVEDGLHDREWKILAGHGGRGQQAALVGRQPIDPRQQHVLHGVRHHDRRRGVPRISHGERQLLQEEGVALGLGQDQIEDRLRHRGRPQDRVHDAASLARIERQQRRLGGVRLVDPARAISRPVGGDEQHRGAGEAVHQRLEELLGRRVDPVQILHDQHERPPPAAPAQHLAQDLEDARAEGLGALDEATGIFLDPQDVQQVGCQLAPRQPEIVERAPDLVRRDLRRIALGEVTAGPHQVEHRQIGHRAPIGQAMRLDVVDVATAHGQAELVDQP